MFSINGTDIFLTRGDSLFLQVGIMKNDEPYTPQEGEVVRFAVKKSYKDPDSSVLILKQIPIDTMVLELKPEDTKDLGMGKEYVYDIELTDVHGHVDTFIMGTLSIGNEVI